MATARDLFQESLEELSVYEPGESINAADIARCLTVANDMLDSWSTEELACFAIQEQSLVLEINKSAYTIGPDPSADVNSARPLQIVQAYIQDNNGNNYGMTLYTQYRWNQLGLRTITSQIPDVLFYDPQDPIGIINIFPIPLIPYTLFFDSYLQLTEFTNQQTVLRFPKGYKRALRTNLAIELADFYGVEPTQKLLDKASEAKANVKRINNANREVVAAYDNEIISRPNATYNIYRDTDGGIGWG